MYLFVVAVNFDKKEVHVIGDLEEREYFTTTGNVILSLFEKKKWRSVGELMENEKIDYRKEGVPRGLRQLELPEELVDAIFGQIDDAQTAFRLGVSNTRLLIMGERRIKQLLGDPNWSGDRVLCARGGDSDDEDEDTGLPEGWDTSDGPFDPPAAYRWQPSASKDLSHGLKYYNLESRIAHALSTPVPAHERPPDADAAAASTVVWNLTKHVYVRGAAMPDALPEAWGHWFDSGDSSEDRENILGWVLILQVTWSNFEWIARGKWAGDRIERTGHDVLEARLKDDGCKWTDVSEDAVKLFVDACNAVMS